MKAIFDLILLTLISVLPALFLLWFFEKQDKGEKEPRQLKNRVFFWGIVSTLIAAGIEINLDSLIPDALNKWVSLFILAFITTAFVEEALKFYVVKCTAYHHKKFNEVMDGITYAVIAGLGFAVLENLLYVLEGGVAIGIMRAFLAVPAHALFSGIMGYYIGKAHFAPTPWGARNLLWKGFAIAVVYHGLYDFFLMSGTGLALAVVPLMILMVAHLKNLINRARYEDKAQKRKPTPLDFKRGLRLVSATILVMVGVLSFVGTFLFIQKGTMGYAYVDLIYSGIFALILFGVAYVLIRRTGKLAE